MENNQLKEITFNLEDDYKCVIKGFTDEQIKEMNRLQVNMLAGHLLGIGADTLKRLERKDKPFVIENKEKNYILIFKFEDGKIRLISVSRYDDYVFE